MKINNKKRAAAILSPVRTRFRNKKENQTSASTSVVYTGLIVAPPLPANITNYLQLSRWLTQHSRPACSQLDQSHYTVNILHIHIILSVLLVTFRSEELSANVALVPVLDSLKYEQTGTMR